MVLGAPAPAAGNFQFNTQEDPTDVLTRCPGLVGQFAKQLHAAEAPEKVLAQWAMAMGFFGTANLNALDRLVDEEAKRKMCAAFAARLTPGARVRGRLDPVATEALEAIIPWSRDFTFARLMLSEDTALAATIGALAEANRAAGGSLHIDHAETIAQICVNVGIGLAEPDRSERRRSIKAGVGALISGGLFRAFLALCENGDHVENPRFAEPAGTLLEIVKEDPVSVRRHLSKDADSRVCLDRAAKKSGTCVVSRLAAVSLVSRPGSVGASLREIAALADHFDHMRDGKASLKHDGAAMDELASGVQANMCRGCGLRDVSREGAGFKRVKMLKCSGCRQAFYCSKECQVRDWKEGGHKEVCKLIQRSGLRVTAGDSTMDTMKEMTFRFFQRNFNLAARRMWQVARRAASAGAVPASVEGGAARLAERPRLRDFVVYLDYPAGRWSVHLVEGFCDNTDVPRFPDAARPEQGDFHAVVVPQLRAQQKKLLQTEASGNSSGQFLSVVYAPTGRDVMCFINGLMDQKTMEPLTSDATIREKGTSSDAVFKVFEAAHRETPNGGVLELV